MAVVARDGYQVSVPGTNGVVGSPRSPLGVPVGATTVNSTNPNNFPVWVIPNNSTSAATITNVKVGGTTVGAVGGVAYLVGAGATFQTTYASGTTTYVTYGTGLQAATDYPFTDPMFQNFTVQQYLTVAGVNASGTYA